MWKVDYRKGCCSRAGVSTCVVVLLLLPAAASADPAAESTEARLQALQREYNALRLRTDRALEQMQQEIDALRAESGATERPPTPASGRVAPLSVTGDFRLRYEHTTAEPGVDARSRNRGVLRGRLAAAYRASEHLTLGARLTTGDPDDPNSTDVTLGNFTDDLQVSLDRAYLQIVGERTTLVAGKFANPLARTDLVWDGDVSPQGLAAAARLYQSDWLAADFTGIFALVDEQEHAADSDMSGAQLSLGILGDAWSSRVSVGYYDYSIGSLTNAGPGDVRGNRLAPSGDAYLSDFDLLDVLAEVTIPAKDPRWVTAFTADYVRNLGAVGPEDTGYSAAVSVGRLDASGDVRFGYGFTVAEQDAVFAAFSHDNITYATNYRLHALTIDFVPRARMLLNLTGYRYRREESLPGVEDDPVTRIRLNWSLTF